MSSYKVSEPSALKFLKANGVVVDENGNVISDSSDYWNKFYEQAEPKPDKILHSDGTIKDSAGNLIQGSTEFNIKKYVQAEPIPAKYLHADGTIDENPGSGGGADLEDNHETTIDVSTYTDPVEVTPAQGKDGMKKATITLENIPSGVELEDNKEITITENGTAEILPTEGKDGMKKVTATVNVFAKGYCWKNNGTKYFFNFNKAVNSEDDFKNSKMLLNSMGDWTNRTSGATTLRSVTYSETLNLFVAVGSGGAILTSSDGISWTRRTSGTSNDLYSVTYSEILGLFVVVGSGGKNITSTDAITWSSRTSGVASSLWSVTYSETLGLFVSVGVSGATLISSTLQEIIQNQHYFSTIEYSKVNDDEIILNSETLQRSVSDDFVFW